MNSNQDEWWSKEFLAPPNGNVDFISRDGLTAVEVLKSVSGSRGIYAGLMDLAIFLVQRPDIEKGCLVVLGSRLSFERIKEEWKQTRRAFQDSVSARLVLVYIGDDKTWVDPATDYFKRIADVFQSKTDRTSDGNDLLFQVRPRPGQKFYEVFKVLLNRWLQKSGPIPLGKLADEVGCSYPTVRSALEKDSLNNSISYTSNRSVELRNFPHVAWNELVALTHEIRHSFLFHDRTKGKPDPESLLNRILNTVDTGNLGLGGVFAARRWHPDFDLHGTPRLDLVYHAPDGNVDLRFVKRIDPALTVDDSNESSPALVIHVIQRASSQFTESDNGGMKLADPVETTLDLYEMSLTVQANQLFNYLRPETRIG